MTMDYRSEREIWSFLRGKIISKTGEAMPSKIGVHVCYIKAYLYKYFEPILINEIF